MQERQIRSYVLRQSRLTRGQQLALDRCWPHYGLPPGDSTLDLDEVFGRRGPKAVEIGFGNGESLAEMALASPETDFLGIEVHLPGIGHLMVLLEHHALRNVRVIRGDAVEILQRRLPNSSLDRVQLYFPDPWPKTRHRKRRIVQSSWTHLVHQKIKPGGMLHMATDWQDYARYMLAVVTDQPGFVNVAGPGRFCARPDYRPLTRYERRGLDLGHEVWDLLFTKVDPDTANSIEG